MPSEPETNQALRELDRHEFDWWQPAPGYGYVSGQRRWLRKRATELMLDAFEQGMTKDQAVLSVRWKLFREYKFSPMVWLLILRIAVDIAPKLWAWWQNRKTLQT